MKAPDLLAAVAAWLMLVADDSLAGSIFCGTVCVGIGPGFVMVVIVVGIISVDMVSIVGRYYSPRRAFLLTRYSWILPPYSFTILLALLRFDFTMCFVYISPVRCIDALLSTSARKLCNYDFAARIELASRVHKLRRHRRRGTSSHL